jgi:hypothetical protein
LKKAFAEPSVFKAGKVEAPLFLFGLIFREVSRSLEMEPDAPTKAPAHLVKSPFGIKELREIEKLMNGVCIPTD